MKIASYIKGVGLSLALAVSSVSFAAAPPPAPFTPEQHKAIGEIVHQYLLDHPETLIEVSQKLQQQQAQQAEKQVMNVIPTISQPLFFTKDSPVIGNPKGKVSIVEFFDYRCPHCQEMSPIIDHIIKNHPDVRIVLKEWPIFGGASAYAAQMALAARDKPQYAAFHKAMLEADKELTPKLIDQLAMQSGLNVKVLKARVKSDKAIAAELKNTFKLAQQLQLQGTPAFIVAKTPSKGSKQLLTAESMQLSFIPGQTDQDSLDNAIAKASQ